MSRRMPGGGAPISAKSILGSSLSLWLRADQGVLNGSGTPATNGQKVDTWTDFSGSGDTNRNGRNTVDANRPTFAASDATFGGKPSIASTGTQWLRSGVWNITISQPFTVFFVGHIDIASGVLFDGDVIDSTLVYDPGALTFWREFAGAGLSGNVLSSTATVGVAIFNGASSKLYLNSHTSTNGNAGAGNMGTAYTLLNDGGHVFGGGNAAEVAVATGALSQTTVDALLNYGGSRYAITIAP